MHISVFCNGALIDSVQSDFPLWEVLKKKTSFLQLVLPVNIPRLTLPSGVVSLRIATRQDWFEFKDSVLNEN